MASIQSQRQWTHQPKAPQASCSRLQCRSSRLWHERATSGSPALAKTEVQMRQTSAAMCPLPHHKWRQPTSPGFQAWHGSRTSCAAWCPLLLASCLCGTDLQLGSSSSTLCHWAGLRSCQESRSLAGCSSCTSYGRGSTSSIVSLASPWLRGNRQCSFWSLWSAMRLSSHYRLCLSCGSALLSTCHRAKLKA